MVFSHGVAPSSSAIPSVLLLVLIVTMTTGQILRNEMPCLSEGGICVVNGTCRQDNLLNKTALCPEQEPDGAVCCNGVPEDVSCREHGGRCTNGEACAKVENFGQLDCEEGSKCCLLIF